MCRTLDDAPMVLQEGIAFELKVGNHILLLLQLGLHMLSVATPNTESRLPSTVYSYNIRAPGFQIYVTS